MYLKSLFPKYGSADDMGGNLFISGHAEMGARACFEGIFEEFLGEGQPIFMAYDHLPADERIRLFRLALEYGYGVSWFGAGASSCAEFNILSAMDTPERKAELICQLLMTKKNEEHLETAYRYLRDAVLALGEEECTIQRVLEMSVEEVLGKLRTSSALSVESRRAECDFLETRAVFACWGMLNDRAAAMSAGGLLEALSGPMDAGGIFSEKKLIMVSRRSDELDPAGVFGGTLNGVLQMVASLCERRRRRGGGFHLLFDGVTGVKPALLDSVLLIGRERPGLPVPVCVFQPSITDLLNRHSPSVMERFRGVAVFQTIEGDYWSSFFGTMFSTDVVQSYSNKRSWLSPNPHGGVVGKPYGKHEGASVHRLEKPLYEARVFSTLHRGSCLFYDLYTGRKGKKALMG